MRSPHEDSTQYDRRTIYKWVDAPGLGPLNALIRTVWWQEGRRAAPGRRHNLITEYLWRQSNWLDSLPAIISTVQGLVAQAPKINLFGDYGTVPLVALGVGVRVADDFVDTTGQRLKAGFAPFGEISRLLGAADAPLILLRTGGSGINSLPAMNVYLTRSFERIGVFRSSAGVEHVLYRRPSAAWIRPGVPTRPVGVGLSRALVVIPVEA